MLRRFSTNVAVFSIFLDGLLVTFSLHLSIILRAWANPLPYVRDLPRQEIPLVLYCLLYTSPSPRDRG